MGPLAVKRTILEFKPLQSIRWQRTCNSVAVEHNQITAVMEPNLNDQNSSFSLDVILLAYMQRGRTFRKKKDNTELPPLKKRKPYSFSFLFLSSVLVFCLFLFLILFILFILGLFPLSFQDSEGPFEESEPSLNQV